MPGVVLSVDEREEIRVGLEVDESFASIARRLGRPTSTVSREVGRNGGVGRYRAAAAQRAAERNRRRPKPTKFQRSPALSVRVEQRLEAKDSPTTICRELAAAGGVDGFQVSPETVYRAVYAHGQRGLAAGLHRHLHRRRRCRKRRVLGPPATKASPLGNFNLISSRPPSALDRAEPGHWEGDLIIGARNASAIVTLVERTTRFNLLGDLPEGHDATSVLACLVELFDRVPPPLRKTLTWDQGREMAQWVDLQRLAQIPVFFAEPHHPWQRPSNEAFNGILRRYVGKGTNLAVYTQTGSTRRGVGDGS
jgi:IS30 family transposase